MSGVMQGPATAIQGFTSGFNQFLKQTYSYQGAVACVPGRTIANAQTFVQSRSTALWNLKKNVVETGWTQGAPGLLGGGVAGTTTNVITGLLSGGKSNTAAPGASQATAAGQPAGTNVTQGGNSAPGAPVVQIFNNLFAGGSTPATGSSSAASSTAAAASAAKAPATSTAAGKSSGGAGTGTGSTASTEVATVLSSLFAKAPAGGSGAGGTADAGASAKPGKSAAPARAAQPQPGPAAEPAPAANGLPDGALGMAQFGNSKLVVYGCGRQGTQVLCVTDLTNQNPQDTLVHGDAAWKDAFLVDDRGDRHARTDGYFLNVDGDRRQEMDIEYGKSAHFILAFDAVQTKVEKVTLRSTTGGLHVADIALIVPGAAGNAGTSAAAQPPVRGGTAH